MCLRRPADNRCCCGLLHVTTGTLIIAVMVICFHGLAFARQMHGSNIDNVSGTALSSAMHFFNLIAGIMAVIGVKRHKPKLLIPLLVIMILYIVCLIFVIIITLLGFRSQEIINSLQRAKLLSRHDTGNTAPAAGIFALIVVIQLWYLHTVYWCYEYLKERIYQAHPVELQKL